MVVDDFDTSRNRECHQCHRFGFDEGEWQFIGYDDNVELYICPDCQSPAMADDDDLQTRVAEQRDYIPRPVGRTRQKEGNMTYIAICPKCGHFAHTVSLEDNDTATVYHHDSSSCKVAAEQSVQSNEAKPCAVCEGSGYQEGTYNVCQTCKGSGLLRR